MWSHISRGRENHKAPVRQVVSLRLGTRETISLGQLGVQAECYLYQLILIARLRTFDDEAVRPLVHIEDTD